MNIRNFEKDDREAVLEMVDIFYHSPGVLHIIPTQYFADAYDEMCCGGSGRLRGLLVEHEGRPAGYCQLSFSYSTEAGGVVVLMEEMFFKSEFRGMGFGSAVFEYVKNEYRGKAARLRLEVHQDNTRAIELYQRQGFETLPYVQMVNENF